MQDVRELVPDYREADDEDDREEHDTHQVVDELVSATSMLPHDPGTNEPHARVPPSGGIA